MDITLGGINLKNVSLKTMVVFVVALTIILSLSLVASAAGYTVSAKYISADEIEYTATATGLTAGSMATYYTEYDNFVYFNQQTVPANGTVQFVYRGPAETASSIYETTDVTSKFGDELEGNIALDTANASVKEGLTVTVNVDGNLQSVTVPSQIIGVEPNRFVKLPNAIETNVAADAKVSGIQFDGVAHDSDYIIGSNVIMLKNTDLIDNDGTLSLNLETVSAPTVEYDYYAYDNSGSTGVGNPDVIDVIAKCDAPESYDYGIIVATSEITKEQLNTAGNVLVVDPTATVANKLGSGTEIAFDFRADSRNNLGEYALTIEEIIRYINTDTTYYVYAYIKSATEYSAIASAPGYGTPYDGENARYNTAKFKIDASGNCIRVY